MSTSPHSSELLPAVYEIDGPETNARITAGRICFDQTIEAEGDLLPHALQAQIVGQVEDRRPTAEEQLPELQGVLGSDVAVVVGSRIQKDPEGIPAGFRAFHRTMRERGSLPV